MRNRWIAGGLALVAMWIACVALAAFGVQRCYCRAAVLGARKRAQMKRELDAIPALPGATLVDTSDSWKPGLTTTDFHVLLGGDYTTASPYSAIRAHYDAELQKRGWRVMCERPERDWGNDLGGRTREYRKGDVIASLQFAGERANYGWNYAFDLSHGMSSACR